MTNVLPNESTDRAALSREVVELNEQIRLQSFELVGPLAFPTDLTMRQLHALIAASADEGATMHDLADALNISMPTASGLVDRLVAKGLVRRAEDPADRRVRHIHVTPAGEEALGQLDSAYNRVVVEVVELLDLDELTAFRDNSQMMLGIIERARDHRRSLSIPDATDR